MIRILSAFVFVTCAFAQSPSVQRELENLWDSGFPAARAEFNDSVWTIDKGEAWVWANAILAERGKTDSNVFARLAQIKSGEPVALVQIQKAERALMRLGYFEKNEETKLYRIANRNQLLPVFNMREINANYMEAALNYDSKDGNAEGNIQVHLQNIMGSARDFSFGAENGENRRSVYISYKEPFILNLNGSLKLSGEFAEYDSLQQKNLSALFMQGLNFEWAYSVGGGFKNNFWFSAIALSFDNRDRLPLPFSGLFFEFYVEVSNFVAPSLKGGYLQPLSKNWTVLLAAQGAGMLPPKNDYRKEDLFVVGGSKNFRAIPSYSVFCRAYGISEMDFQWHGINNSALHLFIQPGIYKAFGFYDWEHVWAYGIGWEQGISSASVLVYYALAQNVSPMDGLINLSFKMNF